jgi:hypothetical protein
MPMKTNKGARWNESEVHTDRVTGRTVRRVATGGTWNEKPAYHTNTTFTEDGEFMIFGSGREGRSAVFAAHTSSGDLIQLTEWYEGMGSDQMFQKGDDFEFGPAGICGTVICIAPKTGWVAYNEGTRIHAVNLHTLEQRMLVDYGPEYVCGVLSIDPNETYILAPLMPAHPDDLAGRPRQAEYIQSFPEGKGMSTRYLKIPLSGEPASELMIDEGRGSAHCPHSPVDADWVLTDRDLPPNYWGGGDDMKSPRCWSWQFSTGKLTALPPIAPKKFQVHAAWTWDGQHIVYHGMHAPSDSTSWDDWTWYVGVIHPDGTPYREWILPDAPHYGHVSAAPGRPAVILDGHVSQERLRWLYYDADDYRLEDICCHDTTWSSLPGQMPHPHPSTDKAGKYIAFNSARGDHSEVWIVTV